MTSPVSFNLPTDLVHEAESAATQSHRGFEEVMVRSVQAGLHSLKMTSELEDFASMPDAEVLHLAASQMPAEQSDRLSELLDRQREGTIDRLERAELASLMQFYQSGQLLKAGGLAEAVRRGLRKPLSPWAVYLPPALRQLVIQQAGNRCGYCLAEQELLYGPLEFEHLQPRSRGGLTVADNLWLACRVCNGFKADQVSCLDPESLQLVPLFDPRRENW